MRSLILLLGLAAASCSSPPLQDTGRVAIAQPEALPAPTRADITSANRIHLIGPFDKLSVEVFGIPELSRTVQVDADGMIGLPIIGEVQVGGKTPQELNAFLSQRYRDSYVRSPQVTLNVLDTVSQVVAVDGEVRQPGLYPVAGTMSLMRAIARAQGLSDVADAKHVVIFRTVDSRRMAALYDLRSIRLGAYEDPEVYPNDVIVVGESEARRLFPQIMQGVSLLVGPLVTVLDNNHN